MVRGQNMAMIKAMLLHQIRKKSMFCILMGFQIWVPMVAKRAFSAKEKLCIILQSNLTYVWGHLDLREL